MTKKLRKLFEEHTVPNFGTDVDMTLNAQGEYINPVIEDHWQTFQEAAELIVRKCMELTKQCSTGKGIHDLFADEIIAEYFGVEE